MRSFVVVALCLLAANANAFSISDVSTCIREDLEGRVGQIREQVDSSLKKIAEGGNGAAQQAREEWKRTTEEFQRAMTEPVDQARSDYDRCMEEADGWTKRASCAYNVGKDLLTKALPVASEKASGFRSSLQKIVEQFRDEQGPEMENLRELGRQFADEVVKAVRQCMSQ